MIVVSEMASESTIPAEIHPADGRGQEAALAMQRLGFKVLHIGPTISVEGPRSLWESTFQVTFESQTKTTMEGVEETSFQRASKERMAFPDELKGLADDVMFVEPPELF